MKCVLVLCLLVVLISKSDAACSASPSCTGGTDCPTSLVYKTCILTEYNKCATDGSEDGNRLTLYGIYEPASVIYSAVCGAESIAFSVVTGVIAVIASFLFSK